MEKIAWTKDLLLGIQVLDDQHKAIIARISEIVELINLKGKKQTIFDLMKTCKNEAIRHFSTEEKCMEGSYYPDTEGHKRLHGQFMKEFQDVADRVLKGETGKACADELQENVGEWFLHHIRRNDIKLASYIGGKV